MTYARWRRVTATVAACLILIGGLVLPSVSQAATAAEINAAADATIATFDSKFPDGSKFLAEAKGVAIFPNIVKAAFVFGGQYGEGVLRVNGHSVAYYSFAGGSWGASIGIQKKDILIVFRDAGALKHFETASGWQAGVDGDLTLLKVGAGANLTTMQINQPIVTFVVGQKGLIADASLTGSKITRIKR
jgi:lipid-binding SYLF domain-containing protein